MDVAIIGTGYVGMVTGAALAARGCRVTCVDRDAERVQAVAEGRCPVHEPGLPELVQRGRAAGWLSATTDLAAAVAAAQVTMICVGTPSRDGVIDLSHVLEAAHAIGAALRRCSGWPVLVVKSTVVPGTTDGPVRAALEQASGLAAGRDFGLAMNPEFLSQGSAVQDFLHPDRIVVGALDERTAGLMARLYADFPAPLLATGLRNAEMVKYAANAFQASLISFANQIAALCEAMPGLDERVVMQGVHLDRIVQTPGGVARFLKAGIGFGGSCFPKDLQALQAFGRQHGAATPLIDAVLAVNQARAVQVIRLLERDLGSLEGRVVGVLGLTFKPDTDDLRESPGLALIRALAARGAEVRGHDPLPEARARARALLAEAKPNGAIHLPDRLADTLAGADAAVLATAWPAYVGLDWPGLQGAMRTPLVLDGRNLWADQPPSAPVAYRRIGVGRA